jgi:hypothetical protein
MLLITVLLVDKLSITILTMALLGFSYYSSDPSGAFTIESMENDSNKYLAYVSTRLAFRMSAFVGFCFVLSLSGSPLPKSQCF